MATTSSPDYTDVLTRPSWTSGSYTNATQQRRVVTNKDFIKAEDINNLRDIIDITFNHTHNYTDSIGSC